VSAHCFDEDETRATLETLAVETPVAMHFNGRPYAVMLATPADLEELLARVRSAANVSTRTTIVLSTAYENRPTH